MAVGFCFPKIGEVKANLHQGSNKRNKARKLVARAHEKISNARTDFLHKLSRKLVDKSQVIVCEDINIKGLVRNHKLAKAIFF